MNIFLVGSGPYDQADFQAFIAKQQKRDPESIFVGIDLGALRLVRLGLPLELAVGDFDSISAAELAVITDKAAEVMQLKAMKDDTDTEIALDLVIKRWPDANYYYFGGLGGRLDHTLSNVWLAFQPRYQSAIERLQFISKNDTVQYLLPGEHQIRRYNDMQYLSFVALTPVADLTLTNVVYPLSGYTMKFPLAFISNEFNGEVMVCNFSDGILLALQTRDSEHLEQSF